MKIFSTYTQWCEQASGGGVMILCHVGFSILKLFEHHSQSNLPFIKTKPFKVAKYKKGCRYLGQSGRR